MDLALLMALDDSCERGGQPGVGIDAVHFAGFDQRGDDGPVFGSGVVPCEEGVLPVQGNQPFILPMLERIWRFIIAGIPILAKRFAFGALSSGRQANFFRFWVRQASS